ncbi:MAG: oxygen-independent coproporphyrinogen III oxidase [Bacteroidota bacterium]
MRIPIDLVRRYDQPGPRYTSYPTAVEFDGSSSPYAMKTIWGVGLEDARTGDHVRGLSVYLHLPFCRSLCWYCGCNKIITRDPSAADEYLDYLEKEMDLWLQRMESRGPVRQIHFGGGTPTFLSPTQLDRLGEMLHRRFVIDDETEFSVEIDPRHCDPDRVASLADMGCNRASLGVQDLDPDVQQAIHRVQPFEMTQESISLLRSAGIHGVNLDLIYGLPRQNRNSFLQTIDRVMTLQPDRLAVYSYAHLPDRIPSQRLIDPDVMPSSDEKLAMFVESSGSLVESGMEWIGMDHFARSEDALTRALHEGTLQRNFQGYSTEAQTDLIGFGVSAISQFDSLYLQNEKELSSYYERIDKGEPAVARTLVLHDEDRLRREVIMEVMCRNKLDYDTIERKWDIPFREHFERELDRLEPMERDGLLVRRDRALELTSLGRYFLRNMAMVFDAYREIGTNSTAFSRTV